MPRETPLRTSYLISYSELRQRPLEKTIPISVRPTMRLMIDSGAFTAYKFGTVVKLESYAQWLEDFIPVLGMVDSYSNLDVIRNPRVTARNQRVMEALGLRPFPVWHAGSPYSVLEQLVEQYPYVAIGGTASSHTSTLTHLKLMERCFKTANGRSVFHLFGQARWGVLKEFPFYSADSTTWKQHVRFGAGALYSPADKDTVRLRRQSLSPRAYSLLRSIGVRWREVIGGATWTDIGAVKLIGLFCFMLMEERSRCIHGEIRIPGNGSARPGPIIYAAAQGIDLPDAEQAYREWLLRGRPTQEELCALVR